MSDEIFAEAYARLRGRHSEKEWFSLTPQDITKAIYSEIRAIDRERFKAASGSVAAIPLAAE